jgi:hypothetical protein
MAYGFQVVLDCAEPHTLADWWAETLGWTVEPQDADFIRSMVAQGHATEDETTVHNGSLVWRTGCAINHPDGLAGAPRVLFQTVPEAKAVKNRMHLDLRIGTDDVHALKDKLIGRGATYLHDGRQGPHFWITMADPEGNEFCVAQSPPSA